MERIERTQIFGHHVISATARTSPGADGRRVWEVEVAALAIGSGADGLLVRFSPPERTLGDPGAALEAALERARRELGAKQSQ